MNPSEVLSRFARHLTTNPWVCTDMGQREMLAGRDLVDMPQVELNGVLRRYVAVAASKQAAALLATPPTILVEAQGDPLVHCLFELAEPVTATETGRRAPQAFLRDVTAAVAASATDGSVAGRPLAGLVHSPLHARHRIAITDAIYELGQLRQAFSSGPRQANLGGTHDKHHRSGAHADVFDATRAAARGMRSGAASADELADQLAAWAARSPLVQASAMPDTALQSLVRRVAVYIFQQQRGLVARGTRNHILRAADKVAARLQVTPSAALQQLRSLVAAEAEVSERAVRRVAAAASLVTAAPAAGSDRPALGERA